MNSLFEYTDTLNAPYEAFLFDASKEVFPVRAHWYYFVEILYIIEGNAIVTCDDKTFNLPRQVISDSLLPLLRVCPKRKNTLRSRLMTGRNPTETVSGVFLTDA